MITIDQALFGYSNGHHMLATSRRLSNYSQRLLEPLSDFSGSEMQPGFTEYFTGCPLEEDKCYALSKTWYAPEMERPGCVWTHTLFIDFIDLKSLPKMKPVWELFKRPSSRNDTSVYTNPIYIDAEKLSGINNGSELSKEKLEYLLKPILDSMEPVFVPARDTSDYNYEICFLWSRLATRYDKYFSFCTGSLSNRMIEKKPLDLQVVPENLLKSVSRNVKKANIPLVSEPRPFWFSVVMQELIFNKNHDIEEFILAFSDKYLNRRYVKPFALLHSALNSNSIDIVSIFGKISQIFSPEDCKEIKERLLVIILIKGFPILERINPATVLKELSTNPYDDYEEFDNLFLEINLHNTWNVNPDLLTTIFQSLIGTEINKLGERVIVAVSSFIEPYELFNVTGPFLKGSHILVTFNHKLALCKELWMQPKLFQIEILRCLNKNIKNENLINEILFEIFDTSQENICEQLFEAFGDYAVNYFLLWAEKKNNIESIRRWSDLCRLNPLICIKKLPYLENIWLLECIIKSLNPYSSEVLAIDKSTWIEIFYKFCNNQRSYHEVLPQFLLPIMLKSNEKYPSDIAYFVFNEMHSKLENNQMDYEDWEKLSDLLPAVAWYNSWDKCKRLRKAAKKRGYDFNLYQNS
ncbi:hypothetical protein [uncultured Anaeromusa sp.]|uniref:GAP1-N1 domain-containing protein n=1 Tax=uncultured Anaeromusa sp. TaxID=673273 RepID=UPI0029C6CAF6|nr:hypothetical protein [uncultured Anaeromusa sp.]